MRRNTMGNSDHDVWLTIFSTPKAFRGVTAIQQHNAIQSWTRLGDAVEALLVGDDEGTAEAASRFGLRHIPDVERTAHGTPLINSIFRSASEAARSDLLCYVNADIILTSDLLRATERLMWQQFLLCGQRTDLDFDEELHFEDSKWEDYVREIVVTRGHLHGPTGMDYFVFPKGLFDNMPPFVVGRAMWDNWLVFHARARGIPVVDATDAVLAIHQNHQYQHVSGGIQAVWAGPEAQQNRRCSADMLYPFTIEDATWGLTRRGLQRNFGRERIVRRVEGLLAVHLRTHPTIRRLIRWAARAAAEP